MSHDWLASFDALKAVYTDGAFSNIAINEALEQHDGCSIGFVRTFTKGVLRDSMRLDYYVENLADKGLRGIKKRTLIVIRMGLYAIESLDSVPEYAAVNEAVALAKMVSRGSDRFVNAILRAFIRKRDALKADAEEDLCLEYSFPPAIVELIRSQYGDETENILKSLHEPAPMVIRTNLNVISRENLIERLAEDSIAAEIVEESGAAILCRCGNVLAGKAYKEGCFSVQSLSSIMAIEAFRPCEGSEVLDMCAAPGGKTAAMAELMNNTGNIISCDIYEHRLELIKSTCRRLGITNVDTRLLDGTEHLAEFDDRFDYVLADVPCSGLGVIAGKPELKYRTDPKSYENLIDIQTEILRNAVAYARPGGLIEYSTCTINKNENEGVVNKVAGECSFLQILEINTTLPYNNKIGFFYCIIRKSPSGTN